MDGLCGPHTQVLRSRELCYYGVYMYLDARDDDRAR